MEDLDNTDEHIALKSFYQYNVFLKIFKHVHTDEAVSVCQSVGVSVSRCDSQEIIIIKLGTVTASDMTMHHVLR